MFVVAFIGVPGVGKTLITEFFADNYKTSFAAEYGWWYCQNILKNYHDENGKPVTTIEDFIKIADGQLNWNNLAITKAKLMNKKICFFDTDVIFHQFFFEIQFPKSKVILNRIAASKIDLYFFFESTKVLLKHDSPLNAQNFFSKQKRLKNLYQKYLNSDQLIFIKEEEHSKRIKLIQKIIHKKLNEITKK